MQGKIHSSKKGKVGDNTRAIREGTDGAITATEKVILLEIVEASLGIAEMGVTAAAEKAGTEIDMTAQTDEIGRTAKRRITVEKGD